MSAWSPTTCRTPRTCGGPGSCWRRCTARSATTRAGFDPDDLVLTLDVAGRLVAADAAHAAVAGRALGSLGARHPPLAARRPARCPRLGALARPPTERRPTFLAWYAHGEWDTSAPGDDEGALQLLRPMLTVDPRAVELGASREADPGDAGDVRQRRAPRGGGRARPAGRRAGAAAVRAARSGRGCATRSTARCATPSRRDRMLMQRPPILVQWSRVNGPGVPFEYAVMVIRGRIVPARRPTRALPEPVGPHADQRAARRCTATRRARSPAPGCSPG